MQIKRAKTDFLITAAELITNRLRGKSPGVFHRWLKDTVGQLEPRQPALIQTLATWPVIRVTLDKIVTLGQGNCSPALGYACRSELVRESCGRCPTWGFRGSPWDSRASSLLPHPTTLVNGYGTRPGRLRIAYLVRSFVRYGTVPVLRGE